MLDISFGELLVIAVAAIICIGPKELPAVLRALAKAYGWLRAMLAELRAVGDEMLRESGLHEVQEEMNQQMRPIIRKPKKIMGDDGKLYEAYEIPSVTPPAAPPSTHDQPGT